MSEHLTRQERRRLERESRKAYLRQPYIAKVVDPVHAVRGRVTAAHVLHDDWCPILNGAGFCRCSPDVSFELLHDEEA